MFFLFIMERVQLLEKGQALSTTSKLTDLFLCFECNTKLSKLYNWINIVLSDKTSLMSVKLTLGVLSPHQSPQGLSNKSAAVCTSTPYSLSPPLGLLFVHIPWLHINISLFFLLFKFKIKPKTFISLSHEALIRRVEWRDHKRFGSWVGDSKIKSVLQFMWYLLTEMAQG